MIGFSNWRVSTRIYAGFGVLIAIAMALAGLGYERLSRIGGQVAFMSDVTANTSRVERTATQLEVVRRSMLRYRLFQEPEALASIRAALADAKGMMEAARAGALSEERRIAYSGVQTDLGVFSDLVDKIVKALTEVADARQALFTGGDELTAATGRLVEKANASDDPAIAMAAAAAEKAVLLVRVANWRFLATLDPKGPATFKANRDAADAAIARLGSKADPDTSALIAPVQAALAGYAASFDRLASAQAATSNLYEKDVVDTITGAQAKLQRAQASLVSFFDATQRDMVDAVSAANAMQLAAAGAALVLGLAMAAVIGRSIARPLSTMTDTVQRLAKGDTSVVVPGLAGRDEIGDIARAVEVFKDSTGRAASLAADLASDQAEKERRQKVVDGHIASFDRSVRDLLDMLAASATEMKAAAESMSDTANQTNAQATTVAAAAEQASANVQTMAAATEEMAASAGEISRQVARSTQIASRAVEAARDTDRQVQGLAETAQRIEDVVAIINGIAGQTNLLALNATIEAARAGDAGKGFAVVASEVKALAGQTAKATDQIGAQIQAIQAATKEAVGAIKSIGGTINEMNDISTSIAAAMEEQGATTSEMTRNTHQAAQGTHNVSTTIAGVSQNAAATGSAAGQVLSAASALGAKAETLRAEVGGFLDKIKAA